MFYAIFVALVIACVGELLYIGVLSYRTHSKKNNYSTIANNYYFKKSLMTASEIEFYNKIRYFESQYKLIPQINLASIINRTTNAGTVYKNELYRNVDFAIFTNDYSKLLLLIELNDSTHNNTKRIERDKKVKYICNKAGIKLITFYTKYTNNKDYVIERINNELKDVL